MSQPTSSTFQALFNAALQDYQNQTGINLVDHPFSKQLETCESISSVTAILLEQAQSFREFRENDGKLMRALNSSIDVLGAPSISSALSETIGFVVRRKHLSVYLTPDGYSTAIPTRESDIRRHWHPTGRMFAFLRSHPRISLTSSYPRRSTKCVLATTHWLTFSRPSRTFSAGSVFIPGSLLLQP